MTTISEVIELGSARLHPIIENGVLRSLGEVEVGGIKLRGASTRWLPWFDAYEGGVWNRFEFIGIESRSACTVLRTRAVSDGDYPFRERRDVSGDLCFRATSWDAPPLEAQLDICFEPVETEIDGRRFCGFKYWFEYSGDVPIHRIVDRVTWEIGGALQGNSLVCRNWLTSPRVRLSKEEEYSTVGLDKWSNLLPGNLWARWSLLPAFDMQYGADGTLLGWFDEVSLIRSVIETGVGEDALRVLDMHLFEQSTQFTTNPKSILFCPDVLDDVDALNLWTRVHDAEAEKARKQFRIPAETPAMLALSCNLWNNFRFDSSYDDALEIAADLGTDTIFIDSVFEHQRAFKEALDEALPPEKQEDPIFQKFLHQNMCVTLDFEVAQIHGGEAQLKKLCERAAQKGVGVISWMATHLSPSAAISESIPGMDEGGFGIFAAKESGRHPDTGYAQSCWTMNLNTPIYEKLTGQLLGVCERTGLQGFLWDSFSNLGWWQLDYSAGTMRPQFDKMMELYGAMRSADLHLRLEAVVTFSNHSCCGMHGGEVYGGDLLGYSYKSSIGFSHGKSSGAASPENLMLRGELPLDLLFRSLAHGRAPALEFYQLPREQWDEASASGIRELFQLYKSTRDLMQRRTVLKEDAGVLWESADGHKTLWSFREQKLPVNACGARDLKTNCVRANGRVEACAVYELL